MIFKNLDSNEVDLQPVYKRTEDNKGIAQIDKVVLHAKVEISLKNDKICVIKDVDKVTKVEISV